MSGTVISSPRGSATKLVAHAAFSCCLLLMMLAAADVALAQGRSPAGRRFLIAFPDTAHANNYYSLNRQPSDASIVIFASDTARVTIDGPGFRRDITVYPQGSTTISLMSAARIFFDRENTPGNAIFDVTADRPVSIYCFYNTIDGAEAFTPLPVEQWGREYWGASLRNQYFFHVRYNFTTDPAGEEGLLPTWAPAELIVIAAENGTEVTIESRTNLLGLDTRTITLAAGQAYLVNTIANGVGDTSAKDISGTRVTATRPIGVISGNTRTHGGIGTMELLETLPSREADISGNSYTGPAIEWLAPVEMYGSTFVYRPIFPIEEEKTSEIIRVFATAPDTTTVSVSNGAMQWRIAQGSWVDFSSLTWRSRGVAEPFAIHTDKPAQAMVVTGPWYRPLADDSTIGTALHSWAPAMSELVPRERWSTLARFHAPSRPAGLANWIVVVADSGTALLLDGAPVAFDPAPVTGTPFRHARIPVTPGDHVLRAVNGTFSAILYGVLRGYEAYMPPKARDDKGDAAELLHPSKLIEIVGVTYACPVPGEAAAAPEDSLRFSTAEKCDSTAVTVERIGMPWTFGAVTVALDPTSQNTDAVVTPRISFGITVGWHVRFTPIDPARDAEGRVVITSGTGRRWLIPYSWKAHSFAVAPDPIDIFGIAAGATKSIPVTLTNQKPFVVTLLDIRWRVGGLGFSATFVRPSIAPGRSFDIDVSFTGAAPGTLYHDTLVIVTDCGTFTVPVSGRTAPPDPAPVPLITGYDWGARRVGTIHDTLSRISNAGTRDFTIARVEIADDPAGAFALVAPDWSTIGMVPSGASQVTGIRFRPPAEGSFVATIRLTTTDGDVVHDTLRGRGILPSIGVEDIELGALCLTVVRDTTITIVAGGSAPVQVRELRIDDGAAARFRLDTLPLNLPRTLAPGERLSVGLRVTPLAAGTLDALLTVVTDSAAGDSVATIRGTIASCGTPRLVVNDHDFDSVWITTTKAGRVTIRNVGAGDVTVTDMTLVDDPENSFRILFPTPPFVVRNDDSVVVDLEFTPPTVGRKDGSIAFDTEVGPLTSLLTGVGKKLIVPARIARDYHAQPGATATIHVELLGSLAAAPIETLHVTVGYEHELLGFLGPVDAPPLTATIDAARQQNDSLRLLVTTGGAPVEAGRLASLRFLTLFSLLQRSELPFTIETGLPYVEIVESPGLFTADPFCGIRERMFEASAFHFRLEQNRPNPTAGATTIEFEIPFDDHTTLVIYDAIGGERLRLVDAPLVAGPHVVTIPAGTLPSGDYHYRLRSNGLTATRRLIVE